ncbi:MAG: Scr1 family TA system antitoxin-like transcriptional regulator, partial [Pseudonocardiaceae bacterium]
TKLLDRAQWPNVELRVLPFDAGLHVGMAGAFSLLSFPDQLLPDAAHQEYAVGGHIVDDQSVVSQLDTLFGKLRSQALGTDESLAMIRGACRPTLLETKRGISMDDRAPAVWRKSSRSSDQGVCVEVADLDGHRAVRDSKNPGGAMLEFTTAQWSAFTAGVRFGEFD